MKFFQSKSPFQKKCAYFISIVAALLWYFFVRSHNICYDQISYAVPALYSSCLMTTVIGAILIYLVITFLDQKCTLIDRSTLENFRIFFSEYMEVNEPFRWACIAAIAINVSIVCASYQNKLSFEEVWIYSVYTIIFSMALSSLKMLSDYNDKELADSQCDESSIGAFYAFGAYDTYYSEKLKDILKRITQFEKEEKIQLSKRKLILICPMSCNIEGSLETRDSFISHVGDLQKMEVDAGANMNRIYKSPVYRIDSEYDRFFIAAEFPSPLGTLWKEKDLMQPEVLKYHRDCFIKCLKELVSPHNCLVWKYDDHLPESLSLHEFLLSKLNSDYNQKTYIDVDK